MSKNKFKTWEEVKESLKLTPEEEEQIRIESCSFKQEMIWEHV